ncbi:COX4-domain-containing protein [Massarina eburnea CBS 473.64]|uniref:Cytochrome c oxidase polypeptide V n=1 Tax=Massarina eburnea CBS 473.64 TaxID=1395130 RepID=A0A6A6RZC3_9PLEO|nr:COX4-domain-containing protein [Massarina eburnea CBS 473.64]
MMRSSLLRATRSPASILTSSATRQAIRAPRVAPAACLQQTRQAHAISNPTLSNIEKRWEDMPPQEQADLWMMLRDRMKTDWKQLTLQEKKAAYFIAFGPHGPRRPPPPDEGRRVFFLSASVIAAAVIVFSITRLFANPVRPRTMTKEWQEATEEYMRENKIEPITFKPGMMIQSKSEKDSPTGQKDE